MAELFKKPFSIYTKISPEQIIGRIENLENKHTEIKISQVENSDAYAVEIYRKSGLALPYLRFRIWQPEPQLNFSQIDGVAGAYIHWYGFSLPLFLLLLLPCCACATLLLTPDNRRFGFGYVDRRPNEEWIFAYTLIGLIIFTFGQILLHIITSPFARNFLLREFRYLLPIEDEKKKRGK